jgi:hypothetical protein
MIKIKISTRLVFLIGKRVYKFPLDKRGYLQCVNEKELWEKYKHTNLLGTIYWFKFGVICMRRYYDISYIESSNVINIKSKIPELNIDKCDLFNYQNWACDENFNIKLIDYGINKEISELYK